MGYTDFQYVTIDHLDSKVNNSLSIQQLKKVQKLNNLMGNFDNLISKRHGLLDVGIVSIMTKPYILQKILNQ